jgi:glutaredoxin
VLVLGRDTCEDTIRARDHLRERGVRYRYGNVEFDPEADARNRSYNGGERVTPVILIGDPAEPATVLIEPSNDELDGALGLAEPS